MFPVTKQHSYRKERARAAGVCQKTAARKSMNVTKRIHAALRTMSVPIRWRIAVDAPGRIVQNAPEEFNTKSSLDLGLEVLYDQTGREIERRTPHACPANIDDHSPIVWTGKLIPRDDAVRRYAFTRQYQVRHVDGLTHDFLRNMAEELDRTRSLVLIGAGQRGSAPLVLERNGTSYRGFLEGRIDEDKYLLILHLTNIELRNPKDF